MLFFLVFQGCQILPLLPYLHGCFPWGLVTTFSISTSYSPIFLVALNLSRKCALHLYFKISHCVHNILHHHIWLLRKQIAYLIQLFILGEYLPTLNTHNLTQWRLLIFHIPCSFYRISAIVSMTFCYKFWMGEMWAHM